MPRWVFLLGSGMLLVAVAFVATTTALGPRPGVTEANARRIRPGMTPEEVEAILGGSHRIEMPWRSDDAEVRGQARLWWVDGTKVWVFFNRNGQAEETEYRETASTAPPSRLSRLRALFGR
jgi:hypothetical protein